MSVYKNFVNHFPSRCCDILEWGYDRAKIRDREVTLMLMVASTGFLVPFERLRPETASPHPSRDGEHFPAASKDLKDLLKEKFWSSCLWGEKAGSWKSGRLASVNGDPDGWVELRDAPMMSKEKQITGVLKILRHALAHGNIYTTGSSHIQSIIFVCEDRIFFEDAEGKSQSRLKGYLFLSVAPDDFHQFLLNWFGFVRDLHLDQSDIHQILDDAIQTETL